MPTNIKALSLISVIALSSALTGCGSGDTTTPAASGGAETDPAAISQDDRPDVLRFAFVQSENSNETREVVSPKIISDEVGLPVEALEFLDYPGVIEALIAKKVDIAQLGPMGYVLATESGADIEIAGVPAGSFDPATASYESFLVSRVDSDVASIGDLKGKTACFVNPSSTSGYLFPLTGLLAEGLVADGSDPDFESVFAGTHDASLLAVLNGDCDAGFAYNDMVTKVLIEAGEIDGVIDEVGDNDVNPDAAELRIVWISPPIPAGPIVINNSLTPDLVAEITTVIQTKVNSDYAVANGYCETADACPIGSTDPTWGFAAPAPGLFDGVRQVCELAGVEVCEAE